MNIEKIKEENSYKILQKIIRKNWLNDFFECSEEMQDAIKIVYGMEESERLFMHRERKNFLRCIKRVRLIWAIRSVYSVACLFFTKEKNHRRVINIWKNIYLFGSFFLSSSSSSKSFFRLASFWNFVFLP